MVLSTVERATLFRGWPVPGSLDTSISAQQGEKSWPDFSRTAGLSHFSPCPPIEGLYSRLEYIMFQTSLKRGFQKAQPLVQSCIVVPNNGCLNTLWQPLRLWSCSEIVITGHEGRLRGHN
ncbi:hypothetical protein RRG08_025854 [Elysia crispata]|uniref:Uncharacterized protein n=1 Tax=Elysia crispata TaxID=231223 RepID=A0AAE0Y319_9GAST|nr:hypothetical protein RRG08_025854 [Elysia crispata]